MTSAPADRLVWIARGDASACAELLRGLMWIGKRRGQGFGEMAGVSVRDTDDDPLLDGRGLARRPIPVSVLPWIDGAAPVDFQHVDHVPAQHPTWAHPPVLCAVPEARELGVLMRAEKSAEAADEVGPKQQSPAPLAGSGP